MSQPQKTEIVVEDEKKIEETPESSSAITDKDSFPGEEEEEVLSISNLNELVTDYIEEENEAINTSIAVLGPYGEKQCSYDLEVCLLYFAMCHSFLKFFLCTTRKLLNVKPFSRV